MAGEEYYDVWLAILGRISRPRFLNLVLERAGVDLDLDLVRCLVNVDIHGPVGVLELAERLEQNHSKVSRSLVRLEKLGLLRRGVASHDQRVKTATVTPKGHKVIEAVNQGRRHLLDEVFVGWSERDQSTLARLTGRFADRVSELIDADATVAKGRGGVPKAGSSSSYPANRRGERARVDG